MSQGQVISLAGKLALFSERWRPKVVAEVNGAELKLVKLEGEFIEHHHEGADEAFLCLAGEMEILLEGKVHRLRAGDLFVVACGPGAMADARNTGAELHSTLTAPDAVKI